MMKRILLMVISCFGVAGAAPLQFYIAPAEGIATWEAPLVRVDAAALAAAEQAAERAERNYQQGLGTALESAEAQLALLRLQRPLRWSEVGAKMQRCELFSAARKVRRIVEKLHGNKLVSDAALYQAQLDDAWTRVLSLAGGRDAEVTADKLKWAAELLEKLEEIALAGVGTGQYDQADVLLVKAARGEVKLAACARYAESRPAALRELQETYDALAELMTARERQGLCEADAAESARAAARLFRREACLESRDDSPEQVAALKERCDVFESLIPLIQQRAESGTKRGRLMSYEAKYASRHLERLRQHHESACKKLKK